MDVLYPYKKEPNDSDLRYSLRSLVNVPHSGRVIVAGDKPGFSGVVHVPVRGNPDPYLSSTSNLRAGLAEVATEQVIVMHDDIFVLRPWTWALHHRGGLRDYIECGRAKGPYLDAAQRTLDALVARGIDDPLFFSLHTPAVYDVQRLTAVIDECAGQSLLLRTVYFNLHPEPAQRAGDIKRREWDGTIAGMPMLSTSPRLSRRWAFRQWIDRQFPDPSIYEVGP